ncbi:MAG: prepilin-type N-terminal cleavage/methylation domain-containing protein [Planctomycetes bacterium]|nr:prepilin-type N-terminal cleavage/methylation domain-containing protein [Planctomycetota bacterium]MBL7152898.1 prepilin-type N-terminal cleavage/methylation domain-containing protein [Phycisphaerae bacterium]
MFESTYPPARLRCSYHGSQSGPGLRPVISGFTVIEILIVVVILAIAAMTAIPMISSAGSIQVRSAGNMIAADLEYAKSLAITKGQRFSVVFDTSAESYSIEDQDGTTIAHPVKKGFDYVMDLQDEGLDKVDITGANFSGASHVEFDYLGSPDDGGAVTVQGGGITVTISVEPVTGYITVTN